MESTQLTPVSGKPQPLFPLAQKPQETLGTQPESAHRALWDSLLEASRGDSVGFWAMWWNLPKDTRRAMLDELEPVRSEAALRRRLDLADVGPNLAQGVDPLDIWNAISKVDRTAG
jgi:hypothetical protein